MLRQQRICFVGAGHMAEALIKGLLAQGLSPQQIAALEKRAERARQINEVYRIATDREQVGELLPQANIVVLAVRPQDMVTALSEQRGRINRRQLVISFLAGVETRQVEELLPPGTPVVRAMPNTPAAIALGITAITPGGFATEKHLALTRALFAAVGDVVRVPEAQMDAVTALSGSGPAYVYFLAEAMEEGGVAAGLDREAARALTVQTLLGAAHLLCSSDQTARELRRQVSSPGGTTVAGVQALEEGRFVATVCNAVLAAAARSRSLAQQVEEPAASSTD
ncbi:MAG: pyrroline-5-carboxylate reductase [Bacillota bacterium]